MSEFIDSVFSIYGELQGDEVKELSAVNQPTTSLAFGCGYNEPRVNVRHVGTAHVD